MGGFNPYILLLTVFFCFLIMLFYNLYYRHSNNNSNKGLLLETPAETVAVHTQDDHEDQVPVAFYYSKERDKKNDDLDDGFESMDGGRWGKRFRHRRIKTPKKSKPKSRLKKRKY